MSIRLNEIKYTILHTEWGDGWGGQERRILSELTGMAMRGHRTLLVTRPGTATGKFAKLNGITVFELPFVEKVDFYTLYRLVRIMCSEQVDIVSTHSSIDSWLGGMAAKIAGCKLVRTRHHDRPAKRSLAHFVHYLPDQVVTCGASIKRDLEEKYGFPASVLTSIPTGIDFDRMVPARDKNMARQSVGLTDEHFVVVMVAMLRSEKRHCIAIKALHRILPRHPHARLLLVGEGGERKAIEQLCAELGVSDQVILLGHRDDVADWLNCADAALLTSDSEGVPQGVTQALGFGLPVVATAAGSTGELVINGETGILVNCEDVDGVANALCQIIDNPAYAQQLAARGKKHVHEHYSLEAMLLKTEAVYARAYQ